jgi:hypothetical protein
LVEKKSASRLKHGGAKDPEMQIAATIKRSVQISREGHEQMTYKTYLFTGDDTIAYMLEATGMKDVCDLNLSMVVPDTEYKA